MIQRFLAALVFIFITGLTACQVGMSPTTRTPSATPKTSPTATRLITTPTPRLSRTPNPNRTLSPPPYRQTARPTGLFTPLPTIPRLQTPIQRKSQTSSAVRTPTSATVQCNQPEGAIVRHSITTDLLPRMVFIRVYLPPCYDPHKSGGYPVLILLHGQSTDDDQWVRLGASDAANILIGDGTLPPFLIIMPNEEYYLKDPWESTYGQIVAEDVTAWVRTEYNTCSDRQCWAIGGVSRGASWALELGINYWKEFGSIGAHSEAVFHGFFELVPHWVKAIPTGQMPRLYLDIGKDDYLFQSTHEFEQILVENKIPHEWTVNPGKHEEVYWESQIETYLAWYAQPWKR